MELDDKIVIITKEISRLEDELKRTGADSQKLTDKIHALKAAQAIRLTELECMRRLTGAAQIEKQAG